MLSSQIYLDAFDADGARLLEVAADALDADVPACPGWDVAQLVVHVGQVYNFIGSALDVVGTDDRPSPKAIDVPEGDALIPWLAELHAGLSVKLRATAPDAAAWNWAGTGTADFFHRRMAHETMVHRWDAEQAAGADSSLDSDLATDGVDEALFVGMQHSTSPDKVFDYPAGSLHLHRTDGDGEWLVKNEGGSLVVTREHAKGDAAVRGSGSDLLLWVWGRGGDVEIFGDEAVAQAWADATP